MWLSQQECNLGEMIKLVEENYSGLERKCGGRSLVPSLDMNLVVVKMMYRKLQ